MPISLNQGKREMTGQKYDWDFESLLMACQYGKTSEKVLVGQDCDVSHRSFKCWHQFRSLISLEQQPCSEQFASFDKVLVLCAGWHNGSTVKLMQRECKYNAETTYQIRPKRPRTETSRTETTHAETTQGWNDFGLKRLRVQDNSLQR